MNGQNDKHQKSATGGSTPPKPIHEINISSRERMSVCGVKEVISFDESCAVLSTVDGELTIEGSGIKIGVLDTACGKVSLGGRIDGLYYSSETAERRKTVFGKFFG